MVRARADGLRADLAGRVHRASAGRQRAGRRPRRRPARRRDDARLRTRDAAVGDDLRAVGERARRRLPQPHLDDDPRAAASPGTRRWARRSPWRGRAASARRATSSRRRPACSRSTSSSARARDRASMLQEPAAFGGEVDPGRVLRALGLDAGRRASRARAAGRRHRGRPPRGPARATPPRSTARAPTRRRCVRCSGRAGCVCVISSSCSSRTAATARRARGFFLDDAGVVEDPATGSAAGPLMAYLHARTGVARLTIEQGVAMGRASELRCEAGERVRVGGDAVVVFEGSARALSVRDVQTSARPEDRRPRGRIRSRTRVGALCWGTGGALARRARLRGAGGAPELLSGVGWPIRCSRASTPPRRRARCRARGRDAHRDVVLLGPGRRPRRRRGAWSRRACR